MTNNDQAFGSLAGDARMRGETRMFLEGTAIGDVSDEAAKQLTHLVELYLKEKRLSRRDVARDLGYSPGVISEVLSQKYAGDWKSIILELDAWLEQRKKQDSTAQDRPFVMTEVAREIYTVAQIVKANKWIGLIYSPDSAGIGKTMTLKAIHKETPGSIMITCDKIEANATGLLRAIATGLGFSSNPSGPAGKSNRSLYARIKETLQGTNRMLLVDQIHNLRQAADDRPFYILTDLWDATSAPQLWCGTADLVAYFNRGRRADESLAQVRSRISLVRDLMDRTRGDSDGGKDDPLYSIDSIRKVFASNRVRLTSDAERFLMQLSRVPDSGALRAAANLVQIATLIAEREGKSGIDSGLLRACLKLTVQADTFRHLTAQITIETRQRAAAAG